MNVERRLTLPHSPFATAIARQEILQAADGLERDEQESALLLVSELIAEALSATDREVELVVRASPVRLRVELSCHWLRPPQISAVHDRRGLMLIDRLAARWGIDHGQAPGSYAVWFEVHPSSPHEPEQNHADTCS